VNIPQISIQHTAIPMVIGMAVVLFVLLRNCFYQQYACRKREWALENNSSAEFNR
jgi:hypothetical protein